MKNGNSIKAQQSILKGIAPMEIAKVDPARSQAAFRAWESRERAEAKPEGSKAEAKPAEKQYSHLPSVDSAKEHMKSASMLIGSAKGFLDNAMDAKTRTRAAGHLMDAFRSLKSAAEYAGRAGADRSATVLRQTASEVASQIDHLYDEKLENPNYAPIKDAKDSADLAEAHMKEHGEQLSRDAASGGGKGSGAMPGYKRLVEGASSRATVFSGGPEMRVHRDEVRQHLVSLGYGKVDEAKEGDTRVHELWEHPDGRTVRITHAKAVDGKSDLQHLTIKERAPDRWKASRKEFVNTYHGNANLNAAGAKPGLAPRGVKVGRESELPFMPEEPA